MEHIEAMKSFRRVYPEREVTIEENYTVDSKHNAIRAGFPDGSFWFIVTDRTVSESFDSLKEALQRENLKIENKRHTGEER